MNAAERDYGINAIIALQKFAGFTETHEKASSAWDIMTMFEQHLTLAVYDMFLRGNLRKDNGADTVQEVSLAEGCKP